MKALSFRQPWAELVLQGRKTLDLRTYGTNYRGPLAIHASKTVERKRCEEFGLDARTLPIGGIVGFVDLVDEQPLTESEYEARTEEHLAGRRYRDSLHGWELANPRRLQEIVPVRGRMRLFEVELEEGTDGIPATSVPASDNSRRNTTRQPTYDDIPADVPFILEVSPRDANSYSLTLKQRVLIDGDRNRGARFGAPPGKLMSIVSLNGSNLRAVASTVLEALREAGYKPTDLSPQRRKPFCLPEAVGVRLGLLFLAVKPLSKTARVEDISHGISRMPHEEAYYWYSKCTASDSPERAQKALRVLLAAE